MKRLETGGNVRTIEDILAETDIKQDQPWAEGIHYEDDPRAEVPECGAPPPHPASYFAPTTALGPITSNSGSNGRSVFAQTADEWLEVKYIHKRLRARGTHR